MLVNIVIVDVTFVPNVNFVRDIKYTKCELPLVVM